MSDKTDEAIIRAIAADKAATPREKELAIRMSRLLYAYEELEAVFESDVERGEVYRGAIQ